MWLLQILIMQDKNKIVKSQYENRAVEALINVETIILLLINHT